MKRLILGSIIVLLIAIPARPQSPAAQSTPNATSNSNSTKDQLNSTQPAAQSSPENISNDNERLSFMTQSERESHDPAPSATGLFLRTIGALLLIVGLIVAAGWAMKRFGGARFGRVQADAPELSILNSIGLGEKRSLAVIRFDGRTLLIGSTPQSLAVLAESRHERGLPPFQSVREILDDHSANSFADELSYANDSLAERDWMEPA